MSSTESSSARRSYVGWIVLLAVVDMVIPIPILALALLWGIWKRPRWFLDGLELFRSAPERGS